MVVPKFHVITTATSLVGLHFTARSAHFISTIYVRLFTFSPDKYIGICNYDCLDKFDIASNANAQKRLNYDVIFV